MHYNYVNNLIEQILQNELDRKYLIYFIATTKRYIFAVMTKGEILIEFMCRKSEQINLVWNTMLLYDATCGYNCTLDQYVFVNKNMVFNIHALKIVLEAYVLWTSFIKGSLRAKYKWYLVHLNYNRFLKIVIEINMKLYKQNTTHNIDNSKALLMPLQIRLQKRCYMMFSKLN